MHTSPLTAPRGPIALRDGQSRTGETVTITRGLLAGWHSRNRTVTIPHGIEMLERFGNLENVRRLTGESTAPFTGQLFADSDIYKTLEGVAWELGREPDAAMQVFFDDTVALLESAQRDDGYLDSAFQLGEGDRGPWSDFVHGHELYCLGHLIQAAIASSRALNDDRLLGVATRFTDLVIELFGGEDSNVYCGHPEIETALVELSRLTGESRFLNLAEAFIRRRGTGFIGAGVYGAQYYQDDVTVTGTGIMRGHAVRALYLNAGVTDLYLERRDPALLETMERQWADLVTKRLYLTGGTGSRHRDEAFGDAYELPSERSYSETCGGIALLNWAWRMFLATSRADVLDVFETTLYNVVLAGISEDGASFFYSNPLQRRPDHGASQQESAGARLEWFDCACCPPNLMRLFGSLEHYLVAQTGNGVHIANYADADVAITDSNGSPLRLRIETSYPVRGDVNVAVLEGNSDDPLLLRVPSWATPEQVRVLVDGKDTPTSIEEGWLSIRNAVSAGTHVQLELPVTTRTIFPHPSADGIRGTVAFARGPVVYCAQQADNTLDLEIAEVIDPIDAPTKTSDELTQLGPVLGVQVVAHAFDRTSLDLHANTDPLQLPRAKNTQVLKLRPYATWGNTTGELGAMRVYLPRQVPTSAHPRTVEIL